MKRKAPPRSETGGLAFTPTAAQAVEMGIRVEQIPISKIVAMPDNPNRMDRFKKDMLVRVMREHGFLQPILVVAKPDGTFLLIDGVHRIEAVVELGGTSILAVIAADERAAALLRIALNNLRGEPDISTVAAELERMTAEGFEMDWLLKTGFDEREISRMLEMTARPVDDGLDQLNANVDVGRAAENTARKYMLSITFESEAQRALAKARLLEAAGDGGSVADGLLALIGENPS